MVTIGIPTLNRYDLLKRAIETAEAGSLKPDKYFIMDNGSRFRLDEFYNSLGDRLEVMSVGYNTGVAGGWNHIIKNTADIRIISNDDVIFEDDTIKLLMESFHPNRVTYPGGMKSSNSFSCFVLPDSVVERVGYFDEKISPRYAYFEDNDYHVRMSRLGVDLVAVPNCSIEHSSSSTMKMFGNTDLSSHHDKFKRAKANYIKKWGGEPGSEKFDTPREL